MFNALNISVIINIFILLHLLFGFQNFLRFRNYS